MYRWSSGWKTGGNAFDGIPQDWQDRMVGSAASTLREMDQLLRPYPSRKAIRSITCPVTLIEGDLSDKAFPKADALLARLLPQARLVTLPESGHFLHVDQPERYVEASRRPASASRGSRGGQRAGADVEPLGKGVEGSPVVLPLPPVRRQELGRADHPAGHGIPPVVVEAATQQHPRSAGRPRSDPGCESTGSSAAYIMRGLA